MKDIELVISKFKENINWTSKLENHYKITIYNKEIKNNNPQMIPLKNVGREGHTYYYHIWKNYNSLHN